jgi:hypothetical protein
MHVDAGKVRSTTPSLALGAVPPQLAATLQSVDTPSHVNESLAATAGVANVSKRIVAAATPGPHRRFTPGRIAGLGGPAGAKRYPRSE